MDERTQYSIAKKALAAQFGRSAPGVAIPDKWRKVRYKSIYSDEEDTGYLKPNGEIVDYFTLVFPNGWLTLASKNEVKTIVQYQ